MKKSRSFAGIIIIILIIMPFGLFSQPESNEEGRAVWISSSIFNEEKAEALIQMKDMLDDYAEIGINHLFCFSSMMSQHQKKWDFLAVFLEEAHERNMKVHPIFTPGGGQKLEGLIKEHPEWLIRGIKGEIYPNLNIAHPGVKEYFAKQVSEALKYDIDGIHLDYIRFQVNQGFSYDKATCEAFKKESGYSPFEGKFDSGSMIWCEWLSWNAKQVTTLVREIKDIIDKSGKDAVLGVDVFPDGDAAKILIGQDWKLWADEGLVDIICPMQYTNSVDMFRRSVKEAVKATKGKCLVYPGIACRSSHNKNTPEGVVQEVKVAREEGADGVTFFFASSLTEEFMEELKQVVFK